MPPFRSCVRRGVREVGEAHKICDAGIEPALGEQGRELPAVVGLVVEEVRGQDPKRGAALLGIDQRAIRKRSAELLAREPSHKGIDLVVGSPTLVSQRVEVGAELLGRDFTWKGWPRKRLSQMRSPKRR